MEAYSTSSSSSSKSAYFSQSQTQSLLHGVRKTQGKPWKKAPVAPLPPNPVKVYKVDPMNFRNLVQKLTGAPQFQPQSQQLQHSLDVTSPPNQLMSTASDSITLPSTAGNTWPSEAVQVKSQDIAGGAMEPGLLELNLSSPSPASSYNWCSFPATVNTLEPGRVL